MRSPVGSIRGIRQLAQPDAPAAQTISAIPISRRRRLEHLMALHPA
jgi:hypothetical protein